LKEHVPFIFGAKEWSKKEASMKHVACRGSNLLVPASYWYFDPEDGGDMLIHIIRQLSMDCLASNPRRQNSSNDKNVHSFVRFEALIAVTMKNVVFWDVALCKSCVNRRFASIFRVEKSASGEPE
jgi:hypothetical protein